MEPQLAVIMLALLAAALMAGFPAPFTLLALGLGFGAFSLGEGILPLLAQRLSGVIWDETLLALPLLLLAGRQLERSTIPDRIVGALAGRSAGAVPGVMAASAMLSAFAPAPGALAAILGRRALKPLLAEGIRPPLAAGMMAAMAGLPFLVPPSVPLLVYAAVSGVPARWLLAGSLALALLTLALYSLHVLAVCRRSQATRPGRRRRRGGMLAPALAGLVAATLAGYFASLLGLAAAVSVIAMGILALAIGYDGLRLRVIGGSAVLAARGCAALCWLLVGSSVFFAVFGHLGGEAALRDLVVRLDLHPVVFLLAAQGFLFLLGWPLEWPVLIVLVVPLLLPLLEHFAIDPLLFGLLVALNLQTTPLTPPAARSLACLKAVLPSPVPDDRLFAATLPYLCLSLLTMALLYAFPPLGLWLPALLSP